MLFKDYIDIKDFVQVVCPKCKALLMADKDMEFWHCGHCGEKFNVNEVRGAKPVVKKKPDPVLTGEIFRCEGSTLYEFAGDYEDVEVPEFISCIASGAFKGNKTMRSIVIPDNCMEIADSAFEDCISLVSVRLPATLKKINYKTFNGCDSLKKITIPASVEQIVYNAMCCGLDEIAFESSYTTWEAENEYANPSFWVKKGKTNGVSRIFFKGQSFEAADVFKHGSLYTYLRSEGLCTNCGSKFGMFNKCKNCGKKKEY
ncbi:MAG: leucine-rich repeat domain-containing protein [Ruminococcus sp.]|nr:leucine-rich repeat domain-containing protein [Ruminococcus sp.]